MGLNYNVFQEPRGVMRVIQFIFAICAFATTTGFTNDITITSYCDPPQKYEPIKVPFEYPFELDVIQVSFKSCVNDSQPNVSKYLVGDFSSDAQYFVATGVLSMLYCMGIGVVYLLFDAVYQSNALVPMADFLLTVLLAVFWLAGSAAWANGLGGLKSVTSLESIQDICIRSGDISIPSCYSQTGSFFSLNISVILGFLNFFLWASDLWFLYKETQWFKNAGPTIPTSSSGNAAA